MPLLTNEKGKEVAGNSSMNSAKKDKNDEFYTRLFDIENEMRHYKKHFKGKKIFLNCDDPEWSNFWQHFEMNFDVYELDRLVATHYDAERPTYKLELIRLCPPPRTGLKLTKK